MYYILDNSHILLPLDSSSQSIRSFSRSPNNIDRRTSSASLSTIIGPGRRNPLQQQRSFASANDDIKPLARLDDTEELQLSKSYLPRYRTPSSLSVVSSPSLLSPKSLVPRTKPSVPLFESSISSYQEAFDDYIPVTPLRKLENQHSTKLSSRIVDRTQGPIKKSSPPIIDQLLTPLPPIKAENEPYYHVGSNTAHHKSANRPLCLSPNSFNQDVHFLESSPHEIGPEDVINRQGTEKPIKPNNYYNTEAGRQSVPGTPPGLLHRQDTVSTASSAGLVDYPFTDMNPYHHG